MKKITLLLVAILTFISCEQGQSKKVLKEANGRINHLMIVAKPSEWQGKIGDELRKIISEPVLGLPQPEAQFEISQLPPDKFGSMFRASRSVLQVGIGESNTFEVATDVYAEPQKILTIIGKSEEEVIKLIQENSKKIVSIFKDADIKSVQKRIRKKQLSVASSKTLQKLGISLSIPENYNLVEDNGDFLWYRYRITGNNGMTLGSSIEIFAYSVPLPENENIADEIVPIRNAFGKKNIPGQIEDSYMITEKAYTPHTFNVELAGRKAFETRGKWEVKNVFMAGPFLNYTVVDKPNNRLIIVEGLTYAPGVNKRDYMFEVEAILKSLKIN
jgi:hypothetical protein